MDIIGVYAISIINHFSVLVNNKKRRSEMPNRAQSHIKDVPGCSIIPAQYLLCSHILLTT